jgi:hypothetical protein
MFFSKTCDNCTFWISVGFWKGIDSFDAHIWHLQSESLIEVPECFWQPIAQANSRLRFWVIARLLLEDVALRTADGRGFPHSAGSLALELGSCSIL